MTDHPGKQASHNLATWAFNVDDDSGYAGTHPTTDVRAETIRDIADYIDMLEDKVDGLESDLDSAVETAYKRGATEWARLNYPNHWLVKKERSSD